MKTIHQFHSGSAYGDAITNGMFFTQKLLRELGFESDIFVEHLDDRLRDRLRPLSAYAPSPDQMLLVHHSMGFDRQSEILALPDRKVLIYHNITPPSYYPVGSHLRQYALKGLKQLDLYQPHMEGAIGDSVVNALELTKRHFRKVRVIPLLIDVDTITRRPYAPEIAAHKGDVYTILFVGRVENNKCQDALIRAFAEYRKRHNKPCRLILVGRYDESSQFYADLRRAIDQTGLTDQVTMTGLVSDEDLMGWYRAADLYLSLSDHEGFGVPLVEAMAFDVPVVAYRAGAVPYTLGEAGYLLDDKDPETVASVIAELAVNPDRRRRLLAGQRRRLEDFRPAALRDALGTYLMKLGVEPEAHGLAIAAPSTPLRFQVEGPCETSYGLAIMNRHLALALERKFPGGVGVYPIEGLGFYNLDEAAVDRIEGLRELVSRGSPRNRPAAVISNTYPPRELELKGDVNLIYFFWEESLISQEWGDRFNACLDGILAPSRFVQRVLINSGVRVPITVVHGGIDHYRARLSRRSSRDYSGTFRFLHISSCFPRKGVDVLLEAFAQAFSKTDNVSLTIKTFPNPHNETEAQIAAVRESHTDCPEIVLINEDLPDEDMAGLYETSHALVLPSRGEGFGLVAAEAMLARLPVIATNFGGHTDFCNPDHSWLVDFSFDHARSHVSPAHSVWVEPDPRDLAAKMRTVLQEARQNGPAFQAKISAAEATAREELLWSRTADRTIAFVERLRNRPEQSRPIRLGWVSTWNVRCGLAAYSNFLLDHFDRDRFDIRIYASQTEPIEPDAENVVRCWQPLPNADLGELARNLFEDKLDCVVFQFNFGFFELATLGALIVELKRRGIVVFITMHATQDTKWGDRPISLSGIASELGHADRILVHSVRDLNKMKSIGLVDNVCLLPHGALFRPARPKAEVRVKLGLERYDPIIGMYGFFLPHKGIHETIEAIAAILRQHPNALLMLVNARYPLPVSDQEIQRCLERANSLNVTGSMVLVDDFLDNDESLCLLESCDMILYPYQQSGESTSGAVRFGIASQRPVLTSDLPMFAELDGVVKFLPGFTGEEIGRGVLELLNDGALRDELAERQRDWLDAHDWRRQSLRLQNMLEAIVRNRDFECLE